MNQDQWDNRVFNRCAPGCLLQYFRMDDPSGFPQDASGNDTDMDAGVGSAYGLPGPFAGAEAITIDTVFTSPLDGQSPNYSHFKAMEGWAVLNNAPSSAGVLIGAGNVDIVMNTNRSLSIFRQGFGAAATTAAGLWPLDDEWHFVELTSLGTGTSSADAMALYFDEDLVLDTSPGQVSWPIPQSQLLILGQDSTPDTYTMSNCALYNAGALTPDFPPDLEVASMAAVLPVVGAEV